MLPSGLRERVSAIASHLESESPRATPVAGDLPGQLALACRDAERIRLHSTLADGRDSDRTVEQVLDLIRDSRRRALAAAGIPTESG